MAYVESQLMRRLVLLLVLAFIAAPSASAAPSFVIVRDVSIGGFPRNAKVERALQLFGRATTVEPIYDSCTLVWRSLGLTMRSYYSQGALPPCGPSALHVSTTATDRRWRTSAGLRIGDPVRKLAQLYPKATYQGRGEWWLTVRPFAGIDLPGLSAKVKAGRILSLTLHGPRVVY